MTVKWLVREGRDWGTIFLNALRRVATKHDFALGCRETTQGAIVDIHVKRKTEEYWVKSVNFELRLSHWRKDLDELVYNYGPRMVEHYKALEPG